MLDTSIFLLHDVSDVEVCITLHYDYSYYNFPLSTSHVGNQTDPYILLTIRISGETGMKKRKRKEHHTKLVKARTEVQGIGDPLNWASVPISPKPPRQHRTGDWGGGVNHP